MRQETIDAMLEHYREYVGRCGHLEVLIKNAERQLKVYRANPAAELVGSSGGMSGMPHGSSISDPTSRIGLALASGFVPADIKELEADLKSAKTELDEKLPTVIFVEAWLKGLTEKERWIIEAQVIDKMTWNNVIAQHQSKYSTQMSKDTLKRLKNRALAKIYQMAE
jgi:hypothetical protein